MTLLDLIKLLQRYLRYVIGIPIICAILCALIVLFMPRTYEASSVILASNEVGACGGIAAITADEASDNLVKVKATTDTTTKQVTLTATGPSAVSVINAANSAAQSAANRSKESFPQQTFTLILPATSATDTSGSDLRMIAVAFFGALFVVICGVVIWDMSRRPIKSRSDAEEASGAPVLGRIPATDGGERLFANIRFAVKGNMNRLCVVPIGDPNVSRAICAEIYRAAAVAGLRAEVLKASPHAERLQATAPGIDLTIIDCASLSQGMGAAYLSRNADGVLLGIQEWVDSWSQVESATRELKLASDKLSGVILLPEKFSKVDSSSKAQKAKKDQKGQTGKNLLVKGSAVKPGQEKHASK